MNKSFIYKKNINCNYVQRRGSIIILSALLKHIITKSIYIYIAFIYKNNRKRASWNILSLWKLKTVMYIDNILFISTDIHCNYKKKLKLCIYRLFNDNWITLT